MSGFLKLFQLISNSAGEGGIGKYISIVFTSTMILIQLGISIFQSVSQLSFIPFLQTFARTIFALDYNIFSQIEIAKTTPAEFGLYNILIIISSLGLLWVFIKALQNFFGFLMTDDSAKGLGTSLIALFVIGVVEIVAIFATYGKFTWPFVGLFSLLVNIPYIFTTIGMNLETTKQWLFNNV